MFETIHDDLISEEYTAPTVVSRKQPLEAAVD